MLCLRIKKTLSRYPCSTEIVIVRCVSLRAGHAALHKHTVNGTGTGYGRCGSTEYAIGTFSKVGGDQPEKFRKYKGRAWRDMGDGFEDGCAGARYPIPYALVRIWGFCDRS